MFHLLSADARRCLVRAHEFARQAGEVLVTGGHLLIALDPSNELGLSEADEPGLSRPARASREDLHAIGVDVAAIEHAIGTPLELVAPVGAPVPLGPDFLGVLKKALQLSARYGHPIIEREHLLLAVLSVTPSRIAPPARFGAAHRAAARRLRRQVIRRHGLHPVVGLRMAHDFRRAAARHDDRSAAA